MKSLLPLNMNIVTIHEKYKKTYKNTNLNVYKKYIENKIEIGSVYFFNHNFSFKRDFKKQKTIFSSLS